MDYESKREKKLRLEQIEDCEIVGGGYAKCPECFSLKIKQNCKLGYWYCYSCDVEFQKPVLTKSKRALGV